MTETNQKTVEHRRARVSQRLESELRAGEAVLIWSGEPIQRPGGFDQTYLFLPHPSYFWISGYRRPGGVMVYTLADGWKHFITPVSRDERVWEGATEIADSSLSSIEELSAYLTKLRISTVINLGQNPGLAALQTYQQSTERDRVLRIAVDQIRRCKDAVEIKLIQSLADMANAGFRTLRSRLRPGVSERALQIEYEAEIQRNGAQRTPYDTIIGTGSNAAILHAIPTERVVRDGEMVLVDAGAEVDDYCVDVTRVYPANGEFSAQQKELYDIVLTAQLQAIAACRAGTEWHEVHRTSARVIAEGLKSWGLLRGSIDAILDSGAISVFYPHGVGHLVGLRVRDTGCEEVTTPKKYCGVKLRVDLKLCPDYLVTVEPGCYFIQALLSDADTRAAFKEWVDFDKAWALRDFGGIRIEDDVLISSSGAPTVLTSVIEK
jgi:Xaa-Pro dipeptidase